MAIKVYQKRGNLNYKERRLISEIEDAISKKYGNDPSIAERFIPAKDFEQLKELHNMYCIEDAPFEEVSVSDSKKNTDVSNDINDDKDLYDDDGSFIDPLNREEPIVRPYVLDEDETNTNNVSSGPVKTNFDEPSSFDEAFEFPDSVNTTDAKKTDTKITGNNPSSSSVNQGNQSKRPSSGGFTRPEPLNPSFDDMSNKKKKKSTQRFAKYIVETVCLLSEKGFVWFANKDINEAKLAEYELTGEIDLSLMVTLEDGQEATIKQFFSIQCLKAEQLAVIQQEEKEDLIDALAEVLLEKGVAPTPTQELMMISLKILGGQAVKLIALKSQTNDLLAQLRSMKQGDQDAGEYIPNSRPQQQYQEPVRETKIENVKQPEPDVVLSTEEEDEKYLLGDVKETIE